MSGQLKKKVVVITGASSGFGKAMAEKFGEEGCALVLVSRTAAKLQVVTDGINGAGGNAIAIAGDIADTSTFEAALDAAMTKWGRVDILINNAGAGVEIGSVEDQSEESVAKCFDVNLKGVVNGCRAFVPQMKAQRDGLIINVSSVCERHAWPKWSIYSAAKAGMAMFSRCLFTEVRPFGIRVTVIVPAASNTEFGDRCGLGKSEWDEANALRPEHIAYVAMSVATMPRGAVIPEVMVCNMSQEIIPF